jgi:hypothetical protein
MTAAAPSATDHRTPVAANAEARVRRAAVEAKRARLVASVAVAVSLNLAAIGVLAGVVSDWQSSPRKAPTHPRVTVVRALAAPTASVAARSIPAAQALAAATPAQPTPAVAPAESALVALNAGAAVEATDAAEPTAADHAVRFYKTTEVDSAAAPEGDSDWNLDTAALDAAGLHRLVFEVQVSRDGDIIECTILEPQPIAREIKQRLENRMREGKLKPAMRQGVAVASTRKIELSVSEQ